VSDIRTPDTPPSGTRLSIVSTKRVLWTAIVVGLTLLLGGVWLVIEKLPRLLTGTASSAPAAGPAAAADARRIHAALFYVSDDGAALVSKSREVLYGATPAEQLRRLVEAAVQPPSDGSRTAIPAGTVVRAVFLGARGEAYVDLGGTIVSGQTGGSLDEALAVYAIVNAVVVNMPDISAVQILIDGRQAETLAGHIDLRYPLGKALDWVQKGQ
jgi:hypothetical protein